jgi:hypothetical protein
MVDEHKEIDEMNFIPLHADIDIEPKFLVTEPLLSDVQRKTGRTKFITVR